jgi:hypothetical protein
VCVAQIDNIKERSEVDALLNGVYHYFQAIADLSKEKSACCILSACKRFSVLVSNTNNSLCVRALLCGRCDDRRQEGRGEAALQGGQAANGHSL